MDSSNAATRVPNPDAIEFVRFCYRRKRVGWPELYDEMCAVAGRALFRGYDADDLGAIGIGLCLSDMPGLAALVSHVVEEEHAARRSIAVRTDSARAAHGPAAGVATEDASGPIRQLLGASAGA